MKILSGNLNAPKSFYIHDVDYEEGWRLACTARIIEDVVVWVKS